MLGIDSMLHVHQDMKYAMYLVSWVHVHEASYPCQAWMENSAYCARILMNPTVVLITLVQGAYFSPILTLLQTNEC